MRLVHSRGSLSLERVAVMGILNVTPDSFSDGGEWFDTDKAIEHAIEMVKSGATVVDVGGESTRPGAEQVPVDEELRRTIPVIERLVNEVSVPISIDTRKEEVAQEAFDAGASILNDTLGEAAQHEDLYLAAREAGAAVIVMHSRGTPSTMRSLTDYGDVLEEVRDFLAQRAGRLRELGFPRDALAVDPGIGFAKDPEQSMTLIKGMERIADLGYPVLLGVSRKSFIGVVLDLPEKERLEGTLAAIVLGVARGARIVRVHDVAPAVRAVRMTEAIIATP